MTTISIVLRPRPLRPHRAPFRFVKRGLLGLGLALAVAWPAPVAAMPETQTPQTPQTTQSEPEADPAVPVVEDVEVVEEAADGGSTEAEAPPLALTAVHLEPTGTAEPVLVRLSVEVENRAERAVSALGFDVTVEGVELPVYAKQLFMSEVPAGETFRLALYNFWSAETGRPAPADGVLDVTVRLREARWLDVKQEDGVEVWETGAAISGLPMEASARLPLRGNRSSDDS